MVTLSLTYKRLWLSKKWVFLEPGKNQCHQTRERGDFAEIHCIYCSHVWSPHFCKILFPLPTKQGIVTPLCTSVRLLPPTWNASVGIRSEIGTDTPSPLLNEFGTGRRVGKASERMLPEEVWEEMTEIAAAVWVVFSGVVIRVEFTDCSLTYWQVEPNG